MSVDYTPTTEDVRAQFGECARLVWLPNVDPDHYDREAQLAMFDRWLAAHDAQIRADAWDEGFTEGRDLAVSGQPMTRSNPYREQMQ